MKNTRENKAKFFAQYWGQDVGRCWFNRARTIGGFSQEEIEILELKPLSQITDEDAIELCGGIPEGWELFKIYHASIPKEGYCGIKIRRPYNEDEIAFNEDGYKYEMKFPEYSSDHVDSLRRKGYAYRYNRISVEQQIEWGWVNLKK